MDNLTKSRLADWVLDYVADNVDPEDVYGEDQLAQWAKENLSVDEACEESELHEWARDNGYVEET